MQTVNRADFQRFLAICAGSQEEFVNGLNGFFLYQSV